MIEAYLHLASIQNPLLANIRCQTYGQQTGALSVVHEQCFARSKKPIPSLLQSGVKQVTHCFSNVAIPFWTKSSMTCLKCHNSASRLWFHVNYESHLTKSGKGRMTGLSQYAQATWLTSPNHDLASESVLWIGKFYRASSMDSVGGLQRSLSEGLQISLCPGRTEIWFRFLHNGAGNRSCDRRVLWYRSRTAGCHLQSSLCRECSLLFHRTSQNRHLQKQGSLGAFWSTWISPILWWRWLATEIHYLRGQSGIHQLHLTLFSFD